MDDLGRLTYFTRHYYELQGIRTAPAWITLIVIQAESTIAPTSSMQAGFYFGIVFLVIGLMGVWQWLASRYYLRRFGRVESNWIVLPTSRLYWGLVLSQLIFSLYRIGFTSSPGDLLGSLPYMFTCIWIYPLFDNENPLLRRVYYALVGATVICSTYHIQLNHEDNKFIIIIQCAALLALGLADHLLLMSLRAPGSEEADA